jgi:hypothetical protein
MIENNTKCNDLFYRMSNPNQQMQHMELKEKCCDEYDEAREEKSSMYYEARIDLRQLSMADLSAHSLSSEVQDYNDFKRATKFGLFFQPIFSICWFLGVLALENMNYSCVLGVVFSICFNILVRLVVNSQLIPHLTLFLFSQNWCMLVRSSNICPFINISLNVDEDDDLTKDSSAIGGLDSSNACADTIPLLCSSSNGNSAMSSARKFSSNSEHEQQILNFIASSNFNMDLSSNNADCISTISN